MRGARRKAGAALLALGVCATPGVFAAGGHHSVDDASTVPAGACEQQDWLVRSDGGDRLLHVALNCGVGPFELGLAGERAHAADGSATAWNAELKWAQEVAQGVSVGFDVQPVSQLGQHPRFTVTHAVGIATWSPSPELALHLNVGRDFVHGGEDLPHYGVAVDWSPLQALTLTAERFVQDRSHQLRAGARWTGGPRWSVDLSRAYSLGGPVPATWTIGLTLAFGGQ